MESNGQLPEEGPKPKRGEMIAVCGAKGGVGRTVLAVNLAVALSKSNIQISVLDGDFQFGDVALAMDLHPTFTVKDVLEELENMDKFALAGYLNSHASGVKVLAAPSRPEHADLVKPVSVDQICDLLLAQHDYVIVDTAVGLQESTLQIVEKADQIFVMTTLEMAAIKNTKLLLETLKLLGLRDKVQLIVNRSTMESVIKAADVPDLLGVESPFYIPNDFGLVSGSLNIGIPFVQNHGKTDLAKAVFKMAEQLVSRREIALFQPKPPSLLQSLFHKARGNTSQV